MPCNPNQENSDDQKESSHVVRIPDIPNTKDQRQLDASINQCEEGYQQSTVKMNRASEFPMSSKPSCRSNLRKSEQEPSNPHQDTM